MRTLQCKKCLQWVEEGALHACPGRAAADTKPSNPKDAIGSKKLDMGLVPDTLVVCAATAFLEGALKYGRYNWRIAGVRASIYHAALRRHVAAWWNGQNRDPATRVHHLDNAIACLGILRDAELYGMLTDDRPPSPHTSALAHEISNISVREHLKTIFAEEAPYQYTIFDTDADRTRVATEAEMLMLRSAGAMAIACGEEGWENVPIDCPMLEAVVTLRRTFERSLAHGARPDVAAEVNAAIDSAAELDRPRPERHFTSYFGDSRVGENI